MLLPLVDLDDPTPSGAALRLISESRGSTANFYRMVMNSPSVGNAIISLVWTLWEKSVLGRRTVELIILRVATRCNCEYERVAHERLAREAGVTDAEIEAVLAEHLAEDLPVRTRVMLEVVGCAVAAVELPETLMERLGRHFTPIERVELLATAGVYRAVAVMLESFRVPLD